MSYAGYYGPIAGPCAIFGCSSPQWIEEHPALFVVVNPIPEIIFERPRPASWTIHACCKSHTESALRQERATIQPRALDARIAPR